MRAGSRSVKVAGEEVSATPLCLPSYSSRAIPPTSLQETFEETISSIVSPVLISAYDVLHGKLVDQFRLDEELALNQLPLVFLDSGGYEALWNVKAVEKKLVEAANAQPWTAEHHEMVLKGWPASLRLMAVTYDNAAEEPIGLAIQIERGRAMAERWPKYGCELLLKPQPNEEFLNARFIKRYAAELATFDVVGVTEKECGASMADRIRLISELRAMLDDVSPSIPLHIFGGLDPYMTPLYFFAGADIFDGLTWLKYAFQNGNSLYQQAYISREMPHVPMGEAAWQMCHRNYVEISNLQIGMKTFLATRDPKALGPYGDNLVSTYSQCLPSAI